MCTDFIIEYDGPGPRFASENRWMLPRRWRMAGAFKSSLVGDPRHATPPGRRSRDGNLAIFVSADHPIETKKVPTPLEAMSHALVVDGARAEPDAEQARYLTGALRERADRRRRRLCDAPRPVFRYRAASELGRGRHPEYRKRPARRALGRHPGRGDARVFEEWAAHVRRQISRLTAAGVPWIGRAEPHTLQTLLDKAPRAKAVLELAAGDNRCLKGSAMASPFSSPSRPI